MKKSLWVVLFSSFALLACSDSDAPTKADDPHPDEPEVVAIDYSAGRAMNKRLGKGINFGNSWDSNSRGLNGDCGWRNCIKDEYFKLIADAGFNSIRLPVRWHFDSDYETHTVNPDKLKGVEEDIQLAIDNGLAVVVNFHHYTTLNDLGGGAYRGNPDSVALFQAEKDHFLALWDQLSKELNKFPDSLLVLEILNEPSIPSADIVNDITLSAFNVIRKNAPNKTVMMEAYHLGKFAELQTLRLPQDGNIIFSGHYYEPYTYSHQGHSPQYACIGDDAFGSTMGGDMKGYVALAKKLYPDVNGGHVPMNMGEFGVSGQTGPCKAKGPSDKKKALWAQKAIAAAELYDISWHYWGFVGVGGFEAYDKANEQWYPGFPEAFFPETTAE